MLRGPWPRHHTHKGVERRPIHKVRGILAAPPQVCARPHAPAVPRGSCLSFPLPAASGSHTLLLAVPSRRFLDPYIHPRIPAPTSTHLPPSAPVPQPSVHVHAAGWGRRRGARLGSNPARSHGQHRQLLGPGHREGKSRPTARSSGHQHRHLDSAEPSPRHMAAPEPSPRRMAPPEPSPPADGPSRGIAGEQREPGAPKWPRPRHSAGTTALSTPAPRVSYPGRVCRWSPTATHRRPWAYGQSRPTRLRPEQEFLFFSTSDYDESHRGPPDEAG